MGVSQSKGLRVKCRSDGELRADEKGVLPLRC